LHQTTTRLVREFSMMGIEDLNTRAMMVSEKLARHIAVIGFREFRRQLEYKARLYGTQLVTASRWIPSSKMCSACSRIAEDRIGRVVPESTPAERKALAPVLRPA
jgi:putative transposase